MRENSEENRTTSSKDEFSTVLGFLKVKSYCILHFSANCMIFRKHVDAFPRDCTCICGVYLEIQMLL